MQVNYYMTYPEMLAPPSGTNQHHSLHKHSRAQRRPVPLLELMEEKKRGE